MQFILKEIKGDCYERFATVEALANGREYHVHFIEWDEFLDDNEDGKIHKRHIGDTLNATLCIEADSKVVRGGIDTFKPTNDISYYATVLVQMKSKVDDEEDDNVYMADASWCAEPVKAYMYEHNGFKIGDYLTLHGSLELEIEE